MGHFLVNNHQFIQFFPHLLLEMAQAPQTPPRQPRVLAVPPAPARPIGHAIAGPGNFQPRGLFAPQNPAEIQQLEAAMAGMQIQQQQQGQQRRRRSSRRSSRRNSRSSSRRLTGGRLKAGALRTRRRRSSRRGSRK